MTDHKPSFAQKEFLKHIEVASWVLLAFGMASVWWLPLSQISQILEFLLLVVFASYIVLYFHWLYPRYWNGRWVNVIPTVANILVVTGVNYLVGSVISVEVIYIVIVVAAAVRLGRRMALFAALLSGASVFLIGLMRTGPSWAGFISNGITLIVYLIAGYLCGTLTNATRRQIERMAALNQVARATSSTIEMDSLLELTYQQLRRVIPTDTYYVGLYEAGSDFVELPIVYDDGKHFPPQRIPFGDGLASLVIQRRAPLLIQSLSKEGTSLPIRPMVVGDARSSESWLGVPLLMNDDFSGVIVLASYKPNVFDGDDVDLLSNIAGQVALALDNARHHAQVEEQARRDSLTGAYNHGYLLKRLRGEIDAARIKGSPVSLIMLDIDYFKEYNDRYGHELGDHVLCITVNAIQAHVKQTDIVGRWGGEEFGVVLRNATTEQAREVAQRIRKTLASMPLKAGNGRTIPNPTVSQGIATFPDHVTDPNRLVDMADSMLYIAKGMGRDQVQVASPDLRR